MCLRGRLACLGVVLLLLAPHGAAAQQTPPLRGELGSTDFTLVADEVSYDRNRDVYEASGNVRVEQSDGRTLTTDWLVFNGTTRVGVASGNVRLNDASDSMVAEFMAIDLRTMVAMATKATLDTPSPGFTVEGESLQRTGENTYRVEQATFSSCRCPGGSRPRPWQLEVEDAKVELGGYAVGKNLRFKLLDVPVFYLPWIAFPAKSERQTGLLVPSGSISGRNGAEVDTPLFITLGESTNLLLTPSWLSKRGFKAASQVEYVFGEQAWGEVGGAALPGDREVDDDDFDTPFSDNRWSYWWRHEQPLAEHARFGLDLKHASDNQYVLDFDDLSGRYRNARFMQSKGWTSYSTNAIHANLVASGFDDLQSPDDLDRDSQLLQRLPDLRVSRLPKQIASLPLRFGFDTRYTYFRQLDGRSQVSGFAPVRDQFFDTGRDALFDAQEPAADGSFPGTDVDNDNLTGTGTDHSEGNGAYDEGEPLGDQGQRLDVYPHVTLPQRLGIFETLSEFGYRETLYFPDLGDAEQREMFMGRVDVRTRLARSLTVRGLPMRHVVEPRVLFAAVASPSQNENPLFLPASSLRAQRLIDGDARLLLEDPTDRVDDERIVQVQLGNRFYGPSREGGMAPTFYGELRVGSGYDLVRDTATRIFANGLLNPLAPLQLGFDVGWDPDKHQIDEAQASMGWDAPRGHLLELTYRYLRDRVQTFEDFVRQRDIYDEFDEERQISQLGLNSVVVVSRNLQLFGSGFWALTHAASSAGRTGFLLSSDCRCWDLLASIEHRTRPVETRFHLEIHLTGLGQRSGLAGRGLRSSP